MKVRRIVSNVATPDPQAAASFYGDLLGLELLMDMGWIATWGDIANRPVQISFMSEGGSATSVPDMSIEVDDVDEAYQRACNAGLPIEYGPVDEPWGVRRFYPRDPFGRLVNIVSHR